VLNFIATDLQMYKITGTQTMAWSQRDSGYPWQCTK